MTYGLGVDLGTTRTAAAVHRDGVSTVVTLGVQSATMPSAVFVPDDGPVLVGEAALRRGLAEPTRIAREFKRRMGDSEPLLIGGAPWSATALTARLLEAVLEVVAEREGGPPSAVVLTHPANWGPFKTALLAEAARACGLEDAVLRSEPEAAALHYASQARVPVGALVAVYDLGGGTFDAAVLRKGVDGFETVGRPEGLERFGGIDVDAAVLGHVRRVLGEVLDDLDPADPPSRSAMARLRHECVEAKEALSADVEAVIPVVLPTLVTEVRLTRAELDGMVTPVLGDTVAALRRTLASAGVEPTDLAAVLLVGGASRMPLVARLVTAELGRAVAVDAHPKHAIALGAAMASGDGEHVPRSEAVPLDALRVTDDVPDRVDESGGPRGTADEVPEAATTSTPTTDAVEVVAQRSRRKLALGAAVGVLAVFGAVVFAFVGVGTDTPSANAKGAAGRADDAPKVVFEHIERDEVTGVRVRFAIVGTPPPGTATPLQASFFYDDQHPESIGTDTWSRYARHGGMYYRGTPPAFLMPEIEGLGTEFSQLCALVADAEGRVEDPSTMTCVEVPDR